MKKTLALLLAFLMVFALFGCSTTGGTTSPSPTTAAPAATTAAPAGSPSAAALKDSSKQATIVYLCGSMTVQWCQDIATSVGSFASKYNFKLISGDSNNDNEKMINMIQTYCDQKVDGFILNVSPEINERAYEIIAQAKIPVLFESTVIMDTNKKLLCAGIELDALSTGGMAGKWLVDNFSKYSKVTDQTKIGYIDITNSMFTSFLDRSKGATDAFKKGFPNAQYYLCDTITLGSAGFGADAAYQLVAATLAAHPDVQMWAMCGVLADWDQGAARAVTAAALDSKALICSLGGELLPAEWDNGYDGCWKACVYWTAMDFSKLFAPALMSLVRGDKVMTDLFKDKIEAGQTFGDYKVGGIIAEKTTYKDIVAKNPPVSTPKPAATK